MKKPMQFFAMWFEWQHIINQSTKLSKYHSPLISRGRKLGEGRKRKYCFDLDLNPRTGNVGIEVELKLPQYAELQHTLDTQLDYAVDVKRESAMWSPIASHSVQLGAP